MFSVLFKKNAKFLIKNMFFNTCISLFLHILYIKKISFVAENMNERKCS